MHPELFRIGPLVINSYGLMLALAFIIGMFIAGKLAEKKGLDKDEIINLSFIIMVSAIFGARVLYVLTHLEEFSGRWTKTFWPVQDDGSVGINGLILLGGVIGAVIAASIYASRKKMPYWKTADSIAPALAFGLVLGRIGCFLNGCCFGKVCDLPWGVRFPDGSAADVIMQHNSLHPTQLYSSLYALIIFSILIWLSYKRPFDGMVTGVFLILYGIARFTVDFFRYYESQMFLFWGLDLNQIISMIMFIGGIVLIYKNWPSEKPIFSSD